MEIRTNMKHIEFYQWLLNCEANTQEYKGEKCDDCGGMGFVRPSSAPKHGVAACNWCGNVEKLAEYRKQYQDQKEKDAKLAIKI